MCSECLEEVRCRDERQAGVFGDLRGDVVGVSLRGDQSRAHGGTAERHPVQSDHARFDPTYAVLDLLRISRELLTERKGCGILTVSPPDLDDVCELDGLRLQRVEYDP